LTDDFGTPAPKLVYQRSDNTKRILAFAMERMKELMEAAGARQILKSAWDVEGIGRGASPGHYFGTVRMGTDARTSVVDRWGRAHDVSNLFIIDGSTFPTSGATEPTSTIQANALRIADYFKQNARTLVRR
jgi:choline dehydrogenase-like flavoprotein